MRLQIFAFKHFPGKIFLCLLISLFFISFCQAQNTSSENIISYPQTFPKDAVKDIQSLLEQSTGAGWEAVPDKPANTGFVLSLKMEGNYKTGESCLVNSDGTSYVRFESPTTNGLIYGVYKYLRDIGFKFYLPDSLYTIIPALKSVFKRTSVMETPFLRIRNFFGTGGFGSGRTDPDHSVEKAWQLWKWRNGFGAEFTLGGHAGETFNLANAKELEKNPSWTATAILKNGKVNVSAKLNYFNSEAVDFFTDWAIRKFSDKNYKVPPPYLRDMASVEPSDGGGYITTYPKGSDLKTTSDQVFYAANVAAKKLDHLFPDNPNIGVNLYAYSSHADIPGFSLNPRIFVQIIPYQFQNVAFGPAFIKRWSEKAKRFGLYDYFKYPDSYWDRPGGYTIDQLMNRAVHAANAGSEGTNYESSYSKFATAIPLWILIQYMCTGNTDWRKDYDQFITDLYGAAAPAIRNLFDIFYTRVQFGSDDISDALSYIQQAQTLSKDPQVLLRINELKLYLAYVSLYLRSQDKANGDLEQRLLPVEKMAWTLYETKIIDSYRIMQLVSYSFLNAKTPDKDLEKHYRQLHPLTFPESKNPDVYWKKDFSYTSEQIDNMLTQVEIPPSHAKRVAVAEVSSSLADEIAASKSLYASKETVTVRGNSHARGYFNLYSEKPTTIIVSWSLANSKGETPAASITGTDKSYKTVYDYPLKSVTGGLSIALPAGESAFFVNAGANTTYTLQLRLNNAFCYFGGSPRGKMSFLDENGKNTYDPLYYPSYIYIPEHTTEVRYRVQVNALKIVDPDGNPVKTKLISNASGGFQLRSFEVPSNFAGKFWTAIVAKNYNYQFVNIPDRYFLFVKK